MLDTATYTVCGRQEKHLDSMTRPCLRKREGLRDKEADGEKEAQVYIHRFLF